MRKYLLIALMSLMTMTAWAGGSDDDKDWNPSEKYAKWCRSFRVDKVWQFDRAERIVTENNINTYQGVIDGDGSNPDKDVSVLDCPGYISWSVMAWNDKMDSSDDYNFDWLNVYLYDSGHQTELWLVNIDYDSNNSIKPTSINNKNGNVTYYVANIKNSSYQDGSYFNYFITEYTDEVREFIQTAGTGLQLYIYCRWDGTHWHEHQEKTSIALEDRQFMSGVDAPTLSFDKWKEQDGHTSFEYSINPGSTAGETLVYAKYNGSNKTLKSWSALSNGTYTAAASDITPVTADVLEKQQITLYAQNRKVYSITPKNFLHNGNYPSTFSKTQTSSITEAKPSILAQPKKLKAVDDGKGNVNLNWNMTALASNQSRDDCNMELERSLTSDFSSDVTSYDVTYTYNKDKYTFIDTYDDRNEGMKTFYYRLRRKNAAFDEPSIDTLVHVQTNYASVKELHVEPQGNKAVLTWEVNKNGIWTDNMYVELSDNNLTTGVSAEPRRFDDKTKRCEIDLNTCETHVFTIAVKENGLMRNSETVEGFMIPSTAPSVISHFTQSKGFYNDHVNISWTVSDTANNFTSFVLDRRPHSSTSDQDWQNITSMDYRTRVYNYSYDDNSVVPGMYYDYRLTGYSRCDEEENQVWQAASLGFAQPYGIVTGQVTYEGNQGVEGVRIYAVGESDRLSRALKFSRDEIQDTTHVVYVDTTKLVWNHRLDGNPLSQADNYTIEVRAMVKGNTTSIISAITGETWQPYVSHKGTSNPYVHFDFGMQQESARHYIDYSLYDYLGFYNTDLSALNHIAMVFEETDDSTHIDIYVNGQYVQTRRGNNSVHGSCYKHASGFTFGKDFTGGAYIDEVRFWNRARTEAEISANYNHRLSGTESGLVYHDTATYMEIQKELYISSNASLDSLQASRVLGDKAGTMEMWVHPTDEQQNQLVYMNGMVDWQITADKQLQLTVYSNKTPYTVSANLNAATSSWDGDEYNHIAASYNISQSGQMDMLLYVNGNTEGRATYQLGTSLLDKQSSNLYLGTNYACNPTVTSYSGYMDEIRFWNVCRDSVKIANAMHGYLSGNEEGLTAYYRADDDVATELYDLSKTNYRFNERHMAMAGVSVNPNYVPTPEQLSLSTITDDQGNYMLNAVPYNADGTLYQIVPALGIHEFSPSNRPLFFDRNTSTQNNIDFTDESSFPVSGHIYYAGTDYPVEGVNFYVDGVACASEGELVKTDENGAYTIQVPIGRHRIQVKMEGHTFVADGYFPRQEGGGKTYYDFAHAESNLNFTDSTLVVLTGRVAGGMVQDSLPHGMQMGTNNIGVARIAISPVKKEMYHLNVDEQHERVWPTPETTEVRSTAVTRKNDSGTHAMYLTITTDSTTGEFSVLLPPIDFSVDSVCVPSNDKININTASLSMLELSKCSDAHLKMDSITDTETGELRAFEYIGKLDINHRQQPILSVTPEGSETGLFGEMYHAVTDPTTGNDTVLTLIETDEAIGVSRYTYGVPFYHQGNTYTMNLRCYELYVNYDKAVPATDTVVVAHSRVTIANQLGASEQGNTVELDSLGRGTYTFIAGDPNIAEAPADVRYLLYTTMQYTNSDQTETYQWDMNKDACGIVLGSKSDGGTNFVTQGPYLLHYILRDPAGSKSSAALKESTSYTYTVKTSSSLKINAGGGFDINFGMQTDVGSGVGIIILNSIKAIDELDTKIVGGQKTQTSHTTSATYTTTDAISTGSGSKYVNSKGDVFMGLSTNINVSDVRSLNFYRQSDGTYQLDVHDATNVGQEYDTEFFLTQYDITNYEIPRLRQLRDQLIVQVADTSASLYQDVNNYTYYTTLSPSDPQFGAEGTYKAVPPSDATAVNMVKYYNGQVAIWEQYLAFNEEMKVDAIYNGSAKDEYNISLDGGTKYTHTSSVQDKFDKTIEITNNWDLTIKNKFGFQINNVGIICNQELTTNKTWGETTSDTYTNTTEVSYTVEQGADEKISINVYEGTDGFGPIFSTVAGQTMCPYEGEEKTKYYEPGRYILNTATQPMQTPKISCVQPTVTDVPIGGKAQYTIQIDNEALTTLATEFVLTVDPATNPHGAQLSIGGQPITSGISYFLTPNNPITQTLILEQTDLSVTHYDDIAVVLRSACESMRQSKLFLTADFVQSCVEAQLIANKTTINSDNGSTVRLTATGYDKNLATFHDLRIEYKRPADVNWQMLVSVDKEQLEGSYTYLWDMSGLMDGQYEVRATTVCSFGGEEIPAEGEPVLITKDTTPPTNLGLPSPINGIYTIDNQIYVDFNEPIQQNRIATPNVIVEGVLNAHEVNHSVALETQPNSFVYTEATYSLQNTPFSMEGWFCVDQVADEGGLLMGHSAANSADMLDNMFGLAVNRDRVFGIIIEDSVITSSETIPQGEWFFLSVSYLPTSDSTALLSAYYAADGRQVNLISTTTPAYRGRGSIVLNKGMQARAHDVVLWKSARTWATAQAQMYKSKEMYANEIYSYWPLNEGKGSVSKDVVRQRNIVLGGAHWWYNNPNYALDLSDGRVVEMDLHSCPLGSAENYMLEFWFRMDNDGILLALGNIVKIAAYEDNLVMLVGQDQHLMKVSRVLSDGQWHHFALQNQQGLPEVYIDSESCKIVSQGATGQTVEVATVYFGDSTNQGGYDIDELRLWKAYLSRDFMLLNMNNRLRGNESGLAAYYPMEEYTQNEYGQMMTQFSVVGLNATDTLRSPVELTASASVPALLEARPKEHVNHTYTAGDTRLVINVTESAQRTEGCTLEFTVKDIVDVHGNYSDPIRWTAYVNRNQLIWDENDLRISKTALADTTINLTIVNNSGQTENWHLANVPDWLNFSQTSGALQPLGKQTITATIDASLAIGEYEQTIFLYGNQNIDEPLYITVKVNADAPDWSIDAAGYEYAMHIIGRVRVEGMLASDEEDIVAAFIDGQLAGVARPKFYPAYNGYFVVMDIYHNQAEASSLEFALWDASTGLVYRPMDTYLFRGMNSSYSLVYTPIKFREGSLEGNFSYPIEFRTSNLVEQTVHYGKGWNWISLNVLLSDVQQTNTFQTQYGELMSNLEIIKTQTSYAQYDSVQHNMAGSLVVMDSIGGYKVKSTNEMTVTHRGQILQPQRYGIRLRNYGWTWIPYLPQMSLSVNAALANLTPNVNDIIKSRSGFAIYDGQQWLGSLTTMSPGNAYVYFNSRMDNMMLYYPSINAVAYHTPAMLAPAAAIEQTYYPVDPANYQSNMTLTAIVMNGNTQVMDAEVGVFANELCMAASQLSDQGYAFLTIPGDESCVLSLRVMYMGREYHVQKTIHYVTDAIVGTSTTPYIIQIGEDTAIDDASKHVDGVEKVMIDGVLYIIHDGIRHTVLGAEVKK